ncbi:hypothetical protein ABEB36_004869 [Hypothenemus hampei]|uniref:TRAF-type domain-containing protein n=1 Tax=Hypothenemus hampei TaxID=57062 RepID=A0ABD1EW49_HYPHA
MSNLHPFTCYFCNEKIENETQTGHTSLCSKVLIPCPHKCGSYIERANLPKHLLECQNNIDRNYSNNNIRKSVNFDLMAKSPASNTHSTNSLGRKDVQQLSAYKNEISKLQKRISELETSSTLQNGTKDSLQSAIKEHTRSIEKLNYVLNYLNEWKKKTDNKIESFRESSKSIEFLKQESAKQLIYIQERLVHLQNLEMDLSLFKNATYEEQARAKKTEIELTRNLEEIRMTFNKQIESFENMWRQQNERFQNTIKSMDDFNDGMSELRAKLAGLVFDLRAVSQISSEASEKVEIIERDFNLMRQEVNQLKVNQEILEDLTSNDNLTFQRLIWRITEIESKLKRAKESDIVLKSSIFYTHQFGYKIRVFLYINGLKKWKDRYALACVHVLKGEYDPLLAWPCIIEGNIVLRDQSDNTSQKKDFSKYIKTKRSQGDEDEDEPQESSSTYIFIPHSVLFKENYMKNDSIYLDISMHDNRFKHETNL